MREFLRCAYSYKILRSYQDLGLSSFRNWEKGEKHNEERRSFWRNWSPIALLFTGRTARHCAHVFLGFEDAVIVQGELTGGAAIEGLQKSTMVSGPALSLSRTMGMRSHLFRPAYLLGSRDTGTRGELLWEGFVCLRQSVLEKQAQLLSQQGPEDLEESSCAPTGPSGEVTKSSWLVGPTGCTGAIHHLAFTAIWEVSNMHLYPLKMGMGVYTYFGVLCKLNEIMYTKSLIQQWFLTG